MGEKENVTIMVLKVDLQCHKCYKKVKKVLCKFPQIRDQIYDEKQNQVVIKVVCCNPEKIRDKICCKGGGAIKSIEIIKEPKKPNPPPVEKPPVKDKPAKKPNEPEKQSEQPIPANKPKEPEKKASLPPMQPVPCVPLVPCVPVPCVPVPYVPGYPPHVRTCCTDCYQGHAGGPCHNGYGRGPAPYIQYNGYYGRPVYDSYGGGSRGYCEENPSACTIM